MSIKLNVLFSKKRNIVLFLIFFGVLFSGIVVNSFNAVNKATSSNDYCMSCHVHTETDRLWKFSTHYNNNNGNVVNCIDCHLPPKEKGLVNYTLAKAKHGIKDIYGYYTKDSADFQWHLRSHPDIAVRYVYDDGCIKCHQNLFPSTLNSAGCEAHLFYEANAETKSCISCHISVGHYNPSAHGANFALAKIVASEIYTTTVVPEVFETFTEQVPGTPIAFSMIAVPGGQFKMGSDQKGKYQKADEIPVREVELDPFWMGEVEVTWDEYLAFFAATASQGRKEAMAESEVDGITGPTPPWGAPDQGWGKGKRPAITMTHYASTVYCKWLSEKTGKNYRLPTEAEWEYAARGGTSGPYFFEGSVEQYENNSIFDKLFGPDTSVINSYVVYHENSLFMTQLPDRSHPNPFGLKNMLGNVAEFCYDYYDPKIYSKYPKGVIKNPFGPRNGEEHVIRGGDYTSTAPELRISARKYTRTKDWLKTDPQIPKSIWWYSDSKSVGFRVVCTVDEQSLKTK
ncbi:MAG: SUMF1/EgtB/PvdO family nonheme iron enzyme [Prolixibacteraceae bacterium]